MGVENVPGSTRILKHELLGIRETGETNPKQFHRVLRWFHIQILRTVQGSETKWVSTFSTVARCALKNSLNRTIRTVDRQFSVL